MTYKTTEHGYVFWRDVIFLPMKKKHPEDKDRFFRKVVPFEQSETYWEWDTSKQSIYYVRRGCGPRLARANIPSDWGPETVLAQLKEKDISVQDCRKVEAKEHRKVTYREYCTESWAIEFDGKSILAVLAVSRGTYAGMVKIIQAEGGYVDSEGIVHRGTAQYKTVRVYTGGITN